MGAVSAGRKCYGRSGVSNGNGKSELGDMWLNGSQGEQIRKPAFVNCGDRRMESSLGRAR